MLVQKNIQFTARENTKSRPYGAKKKKKPSKYHGGGLCIIPDWSFSPPDIVFSTAVASQSYQAPLDSLAKAIRAREQYV